MSFSANPNRETESGGAFSRRAALLRMTAGVAAGSLALPVRPSPVAGEEGSIGDFSEAQVKAYLKPLLMTKRDVDGWRTRKVFPFSKYDPILGYLHIDRDFKEGVNDAVCRYRYDKLGARLSIAHANKPCRISTYGDSFTSCEQVSDEETWQEVLAAHLGEPVRNYGIGGYSVYQAYLRMLREERRAPAKFIIFNIFDDDHCRNLHGWQRFKFGVNRKAANPPVPFVEVDPKSGRFVERPNPCPTSESLDRLYDLEAAYEMFKSDFVLQNRLERAARRKAKKSTPASDYDDVRLMKFGQFATMRIVERVGKFAEKHDRKVLFVLSYGGYTIKQFIETGFRFDQPLVDFFSRNKLPYVDMMQAHARDFAKFRVGVDEYFRRYFIGHYNPLGNFFCAYAMKDELVKMLEPKPVAYSR